MNLQNLEAFCRLAEVEHYGKASDELGIAQPSLSRLIRRMEDDLGVSLFKPVGRNIRLTKMGKIYYEKVRKGLEEIKSGADTIQDIVDPYFGSIDLGFIFTLGPEIIPELLKQFRSDPDRANYKFKFWQGNTPRLIENAKNEICDFSICSYLKNEPEIEFFHLLDQPLVAIVAKSHPYAKQKKVSMEELSKVPMILCLDKTYFIENLFRKEKLPLTIACRVEEDQALTGLVSINLGAAILPYNKLMKHHDVAVLQLETPVYRPVYLAKRKDIQLPAGAKAFESFLKQKEFVLSSELPY
ncbi:LysR family transcriptional regulator [Enterococcus sp. 669A]|uniref:LysR family transcriptional regulator n=1 Tax=Candidatus Enterococcus moelleringii TaxID=2815325 RepID=A0ABS3LCE6_9ENTE|nr:LysR family transcriptional regulator [Enterococcus sp. 669A]MBO1307307.1 LysR family transcriptional regulator [Enterococcus sp. 669A]